MVVQLQVNFKLIKGKTTFVENLKKFGYILHKETFDKELLLKYRDNKSKWSYCLQQDFLLRRIKQQNKMDV